MGAFLQRHFANLRNVRTAFRIDPRGARATTQIAPWLSGVVQLVHPAIAGAFDFHDPVARPTPNPAVGVGFSIVVPPNEAWRLRTIRLVLTTGVAVANRTVLINFDDGTNVFFVIPAVSDQAASTVFGYNYGRMFGYESEGALTKTHSLPDIILDTGWRILVTAPGLQAADQFSEIVVLVDVFPR